MVILRLELEHLENNPRSVVVLGAAIGPKNKGGMNNMDWTIHSEGFTSEWFIRYAHPTQSAWKEILDYMLFTDKQGNLSVEKHVLLYSKLTNAQKLKLLHKLPKTAKYIRTCLTDFWKLNLTPTEDLKRRVIASESLWFNHSFDVQINWRTRKYLLQVAVGIQPLTSHQRAGCSRQPPRSDLAEGCLHRQNGTQKHILA